MTVKDILDLSTDDIDIYDVNNTLTKKEWFQKE